MDDGAVLLIGGCALLTSALTAVLGFGGGVVLLAVLVAFVEPLVAIPLQAAIQVVSNGTRTVVRRSDVDWSIVGRTSLLLLPAGAHTAAGPARPRGGAAGRHRSRRPRGHLVARAPGPTAPRTEQAWGWVGLGGAIGALNPVVGATGPLAAPFFRAGTRDRLAFVGTFAGSQVTGHLTKLVLFGSVGLLPVAQAPAAAAGIAGVVVGTWVGSAILDRMSEHRFDRLYLVAITAIALWLLVDALR